MKLSIVARRLIRWGLAILYTLSIFVMANFVVPLWNWFTASVGVERGGHLVDIAVPIVGLLVAVAVLIVMGRRVLPAYAWLVAIVGGYAYLLALHCEYPVERIHLIQYSLVAWFYFTAIRLDAKVRTSIIVTAAAVFLVGTFDEVAQHFIPDRSMTFSDMVINWTAGSLGMFGLLVLNRDIALVGKKNRPAIIQLAVGHIVPLVLAAFLAQQVWTRYLHPPLNVILITVDCARPDRFGIYGYERNTSRYTDDLFKDGVRFTSAYSQAAWTGPGVLSTLTGLYPQTHGVFASGRSLPKAAITLQDIFREHMYAVPNMTYLTVAPNYYNLGAEDDAGIDVTKLGEAEGLVKWIGDHHREPFFIWHHYRHVHLPYDPKPKERHQIFPPLNDSAAIPPPEISKWIQKEVIVPWGEVEFSKESKPWLDALYDSEIHRYDHVFEAIRYRLSLHHILRNTLIVVTADHGEELLEHGYVGHASTAVHSRHYDEHIHIPLLMYAPRVLPKGLSLDNLVQQVDIAPTILDIMGWEIPEDMQGRSLLPIVRGEPFEDRPVFAESIEGGYQSKENMRRTFVRSVRTKEWKLITRTSPEGEEFELYDLANDPSERENVFDKHRDVGGKLYGELAAWITQSIDGQMVIADRQRLLEARQAIESDVRKAIIPEIIEPASGVTLDYETSGGSVTIEWTGNPVANYIIQYHIGTGWHTLKGKVPAQGLKKVFGPVPRDGWEPLHQWNPYRLRVRPKGMRDGWSDWITLNVAPLD